MENKKLTSEQRSKIGKLWFESAKHRIWIGLKYNTAWLFANLLVMIINVSLMSKAFVIVGFGMNIFFILPAWFRELRKEHDRVREEAKKILES